MLSKVRQKWGKLYFIYCHKFTKNLSLTGLERSSTPHPPPRPGSSTGQGTHTEQSDGIPTVKINSFGLKLGINLYGAGQGR